ncbi:MAG: hypothetical protein H6Q10_1561 [Acidobacteria bacterium]|nr:hypothetical protein [Acidobacteriota bacterium]
MNRVWVLLAPLAVALAAGQVAAQPAVPAVYVSNFTGGQVLSVNTANGTTTVLLSRASIGDADFSPQDMVVGPDGNLYICDSLNGRVWRYVVGQPVAPSVNPLVVATFGAGVYPEGPSFSGSDDLYVNARGSGPDATGGTAAAGLWVVPGVALPGTVLPIAPLQVVPSIGSAGEATAFAAPGHLLAVDNAAGKVVSLKPLRGGFPQYGSSSTTLISSNLSAPVGIAVNTCGDVLASSGNTIRRFTTVKNTTTGELSAQFANTYVTFPRGDVVTFLERDAANVLWVNTNSANAGGKVWMVAPATAPGGDPIASCSSGVLPAQPLVSLKSLGQGSNPLLAKTQLQAVGLAIPASSFTAAKVFGPGSPSQTWNFGHYSVRVEYRQVYSTFSQSLTALMTRPQDIAFATGTFLSGTEPTRFPSVGGFVTEFRSESPEPVAGTDFATATATEPAFRFLIFYNDPIQGFRNPGVAHAAADSTTYTENQSLDVWVAEDGVRAGGGTGWSKYVGFDEPLQPGLALPLRITLNQPALSGNPLFNLGQNFTVSITVTDDNGQVVPGLSVRLSAMRISPKPFVFETVRPTNGSGLQNILNDNGNGKYSIGVDTGLFQGGTGTYQFTLFGNGFPPYVFYARFQK